MFWDKKSASNNTDKIEHFVKKSHKQLEMANTKVSNKIVVDTDLWCVMFIVCQLTKDWTLFDWKHALINVKFRTSCIGYRHELRVHHTHDECEQF